MRLFFVFAFIFIATTAFCQKQNVWADSLTNRLCKKTWFIEKECNSDTCRTYSFSDSSDYFYFTSKDLGSHADTLSTTYIHFGIYITDPVGDTLREFVSACNPFICIIKPLTKQNNYRTVTLSVNSDNNRIGELTFLSDKEFLLQPGVNSDKEYYKLIPTPKKVLAYIEN